MLDLFFLEPYALMRASFVTIYITIASSVGGTILGVCYWLVARKAEVYSIVYMPIDALRVIPNLVIIFVVYYFPYQQLGLWVPGPTASAIIGLAIAQAAYTCDSVRAAFNLVPQKHVEGLKGVGAHDGTLWRHAYLPGMIRISWAPHVAFWIGNLKLSSLASVIGAPDLAYVARVSMANTFRSLDAWLAVSVIYIALAVPVIMLAKRFERHRYFYQ